MVDGIKRRRFEGFFSDQPQLAVADAASRGLQSRVRTVGTKLTDREHTSGTVRHVQLTIRLLRETDGRRIADVSELPGVTVYGASPQEATVKPKALALRVIAEEIEHGELQPEGDTLHFSVAA